MVCFWVFPGQQFYHLLRLGSVLASPFHHRQEGAEPSQDNSADAEGEEACCVALASHPVGCLTFVLGLLCLLVGAFEDWHSSQNLE